jgi:predicted ATPase
MLLRRLQLRRLLSFGPDAPEIEFSPLNLIIGPNGSGKSNLIDAISLLQASTGDLTAVIREGGGIQAWLWKGDREGKAEVEAMIGLPSSWLLRHRLAFVEEGHRLAVVEEHLSEQYLDPPDVQTTFTRDKRRATLYADGDPRAERREVIDSQRSVLDQRRDPDLYPALAGIGEAYARIKIYRGWTFGRKAPPRWPQPADLPTDHLLEDASNLALVLNGYRLHGDVWEAVRESLRELYDGIDDFHVQVQGGTVQLFFTEGGRRSIPASRLSDGTLRWLSLLAVLLNPNPPRLVCIEEPELGLHPDLIPELARLLKSASERMQLVVTTHSSSLVDAFSDSPESVQVCERKDGSTVVRRLGGESLTEWLKLYSLGDLWARGHIGGTRW